MTPEAQSGDPVIFQEPDKSRQESESFSGGQQKFQVAQRESCLSRQLSVDRTKGAGKNDENIVASLCSWIIDHQIGIAMNLLLLLGLTHMSFPRSRRYTRKFLELSYFNEDSQKYSIGWDDTSFVVFWIISITGLRVAVMDYLFYPWAKYAGISKNKERIRFAEQAWLFVYEIVFWSLGMYIFYRSDYWLNLERLWTGWPDRELNGLVKWYYLVQFAFWLQQILVVNIEERRKDHLQMCTHHLVTCALMFNSYAYHYTKVGNVILCLMDGVDIILALAKMLKYLKFRLACDIMFGIFMVTWVALRHVAYIAVCYSIFTDYLRVVRFGCYTGSNANLVGPFQPPDNLSYLLTPFRNPEGLVCQTETTTAIFVLLLLSLQALLLIWFGMIVRVALRVAGGGGAEDSRSDEEAEEDSPSNVTRSQKNSQPLEVGMSATTGVVSSGTKTTAPRRYRRNGAASSGVMLPHDKKELLGRIGCDKG